MWLQVFVLLSGFAVLVYPFQPPHIIYIIADDMGWNDVSFHGSDQIPTPNIDSLAYNGVILNRHYVQPVCTPSRASLMTGKYPIHTGIHVPLSPDHKTGLNLSEKILPQYLKEMGYMTRIVGKWHLGFYKKPFTPLERGFDSHFGYWSGAISYYDHIDESPGPTPPNTYTFSGHDLRRNRTSAWDVVGQYATDLFTNEAVHEIENHPPDKPLFLYLSHLAVHAGNQGKWLEAPQEDINRFSYISDPNRRTYAAMVSKLDQSVGAVVGALDKRNMLNNSIIVFISDNGAPIVDYYSNWGSNYPWRGQKASLWEGGVRVPALIWSPLISRYSRVSYDLMHITDWLPTLLAAAGKETTQLAIDGLNHWLAISQGYPGPRNDLVVDIDEEMNMFSLIISQFKYLKGPTTPGTDPLANTFLNFHSIKSPKGPIYDITEIYKSATWQAVQKYTTEPLTEGRIKDLRKTANVTCNHDFQTVINCTTEPCLFNLQLDPCEQKNIAKLFPSIVKEMEKMINNYKLGAVPDVTLYKDLASNPECFNGSWSIWED